MPKFLKKIGGLKIPGVSRHEKHDSPIHFESVSDDEYLVVLKDIPVQEKKVLHILKALGKKIPRHEVEFELEKKSLRVEGPALDRPIVKDYFALIISKVKWVAFGEGRVPVRIHSKKVSCVEFKKIDDRYSINIEIRGVYTDTE